MKKLFATTHQTLAADAALLFLRLLFGYAFFLAGQMKIGNPASWMPPNIALPGFLQALAAISEFGGGILIMLGLLTRLGAFGILCTMLVALYFHIFVFGDPFVNPTGGSSYQIAAAYAGIAFLLLTAGPGRFSADRILFGQHDPYAYHLKEKP